MVSDGVTTLGTIREISSLLTIVKLSELVIGIFWLFLTLKIFRECMNIRRKHRSVFFLRPHREEKVAGVLRDLIAFYRGYYQEIRLVLLITFLVDLSMIASTIYLMYSNLILPEDFYFHLFIGIATSVFSLNALIFVEKK